jgi:hypothetical protein
MTRRALHPGVGFAAAHFRKSIPTSLPLSYIQPESAPVRWRNNKGDRELGVGTVRMDIRKLGCRVSP